ncbi:magnesium transport protein CorA [Actinorhabdospora filicis]|uniref:Magnesium transport protein CorA n=1 Tax=Actinorhabdospora filicis TaxID=1785913 RepID=A0A9W6SN28_9ACTN|nr:magnesium and cobalt transport protein CorA [Actinorhabdospora filicis]GLZ79934.1 magnesium transport protein CorA [Actinorhabdospora filicis]
MPFVATAYRAGRRIESTGPPVDALNQVREQRGGFVWVDLVAPTREEFESLTDQLGMSGLPFTELTQHRPRHAIERVNGLLLIALKAFVRTDGETTNLATTRMLICVTEDAILTAHDGAPELLTGVRRRLEARTKFLACGPHAVVQAVCDEVVTGYDKIAHEIEGDIIELEHDVFDEHGVHPMEEIYAIKREVLFFRRVEDPLHAILSDLARGDVEVHKGTQEAFQRTLDRLDRVDGTIDGLNELITNILQAHLAQVAVRQNEDMRKISSWAAIIAVPTMIAGFYGMNFEFMPETKWKVGYPLVVLVIAIASWLVYRKLKKSGWL